MDFVQFESVYYFFVQLDLDHTHVNQIDEQMKHDDSHSTVQLIRQIQDFHTMRKELCQSILKHFERTGMSKAAFEMFHDSSGVLEYSRAPAGSVCAFTGVQLTSQSGFMIIVDNQTPIAIDRRLKNVIYNFWYILHLPKEMIKEAIDFLKKRKRWRDGRMQVDQVIEKLSKEHVFAKRAYVKLSSVCKYIQSDMLDIPINSMCT